MDAHSRSLLIEDTWVHIRKGKTGKTYYRSEPNNERAIPFSGDLGVTIDQLVETAVVILKEMKALY
jgi:hypothetical protein